MSDTSDVEQARSGVGFGTVVRLLAIALGVVSTVLIARDGFKIHLNEYLNAVLVIYDDAFTHLAIVAIEPSIKFLFAKLHEWFDIHVQLLSHWKYVFVLCWLFYGAFGRVAIRVMREMDELSGEGSNVPMSLLLFLAWNGVVAAASGIAAGTGPIESDGVYGWPFAGFFLWASGFFAFATLVTDDESGNQRWRGVLVTLLMLAMTVIAALHATGVRLSTAKPAAWLQITESPGLASLATAVAIVGLACLVFSALGGLLDDENGWQRFNNPLLVKPGVDILSVLGGAAFIVWLGNALA